VRIQWHCVGACGNVHVAGPLPRLDVHVHGRFCDDAGHRQRVQRQLRRDQPKDRIRLASRHHHIHATILLILERVHEQREEALGRESAAHRTGKVCRLRIPRHENILETIHKVILLQTILLRQSAIQRRILHHKSTLKTTRHVTLLKNLQNIRKLISLTRKASSRLNTTSLTNRIVLSRHVRIILMRLQRAHHLKRHRSHPKKVPSLNRILFGEGREGTSVLGHGRAIKVFSRRKHN